MGLTGLDLLFVPWIREQIERPGLAIVKEIVEAHGGRMMIETSTAGSKLTVKLPRSRSI